MPADFFALHPIVKVAAGRTREVGPGAWVLAAMSFLCCALGIPHQSLPRPSMAWISQYKGDMRPVALHGSLVIHRWLFSAFIFCRDSEVTGCRTSSSTP